MEIHKYLFLIKREGIRTYKFTKEKKYELIKYRGEDYYKGNEIKGLYPWFEKVASIAKEDGIDFCILSEEPYKGFIFEYDSEMKSSWRKKEILDFCQEQLENTNYEIMVSRDQKFYSQVSNVYNLNEVKSLYLKCIPEFSFVQERNLEDSKDETSILSKFFIEKLKEIK